MDRHRPRFNMGSDTHKHAAICLEPLRSQVAVKLIPTAASNGQPS